MLSYILVCSLVLIFKDNLLTKVLSFSVILSYLISYITLELLPTQPALLLSSISDIFIMSTMFHFLTDWKPRILYTICLFLKVLSTFYFQYPLASSIGFETYLMKYSDMVIIEIYLLKVLSDFDTKKDKDYLLVSAVLGIFFIF